MTPEEIASDLVRLVLSADTNREAETPVAAALTNARAEGRLAGLEEAADGVREAIRRWASGRFDEPRNIGEAVAAVFAQLRSLAGDGPKAPQDPKTHEIPAGRQG